MFALDIFQYLNHKCSKRLKLESKIKSFDQVIQESSTLLFSCLELELKLIYTLHFFLYKEHLYKELQAENWQKIKELLGTAQPEIIKP